MTLSSTVHLYADDTLIYRAVHSEADIIALQSDLNTIMKWAEDWQMSFNPKKTEFLRITNKHNYISSSYCLQSTPIPLVDHVKYLGVIIDKNLNWSKHVNMISAKANSVRGFLQRNLTKCPLSVKSSCYTTLVRPILEYACTVWSPYHQHNIAKLEMVQRRAARFVANNYDRTASVTELLHRLQWDTLEARRNNLRVILLYKIINKIVDIYAEGQLIFANSVTRGHSLKLLQLPTMIDAYKNSFFPSAIRTWNNLPSQVVEATTLDLFKHSLNM